MIPKSLSATSILVSEGCMERWKVENFYRTPQPSSDPANVGTSVHFALEQFVQAVYLNNKLQWDDITTLKAFYDMGYTATFMTGNYDTPEYKDGAALVARWYDRNRQGLPYNVVSCEVKETFPIRTSIGEIPWNYIWDRADQISDDEYEIVDYKSLRAPVSTEDLKKKIQSRSYAVAGQIKWPHAKRIWVTFDMLRYEPVSVCFTRDENIATYRYMQRAAERIITTDEDKTEETINPECKWCIKKTTCETLQSSVAGGSVMSLSLDELAKRKLQVSSQLDALKYANEEIDKAIFAEAQARDEMELDAGENMITFSTRSMRKPNSSAIAHIVGPELSVKYGNFTMTNIDKMLAAESLTPDIRKAIEAEITRTWSEPKPVVKPKEF